MAHDKRRPRKRSSISAAADLVKVRQRMLAAGVPSSSRRSIRSVRTLVLPVPADASTHAEVAGLEASC